MIVYICPECGGDLQEMVLDSYPPIYKKECLKCGWSYSLINGEEIIKIPYPLPPDACKHCSNHPSNGGSGICNCTLGSPVIY